MSKNAFFPHLKSADFETVCDWSTSSWRNNLDTPWCNNLVCNDLDDVITLWCDVKIVTPQGYVLFTAFGKLMFEYIFWYQVNEWFLNDIAQKFWKIMAFQKMINSHDVQLVNSKQEKVLLLYHVPIFTMCSATTSSLSVTGKPVKIQTGPKVMIGIRNEREIVGRRV